MAEQIKFTDEELQELKSLQDAFNNTILQFGQLSVEEINLQNATQKLGDSRDRLEESYRELLKKEKSIAEQLNAKYGPGILEPKTGIFTPAPKVESVSQGI